MVIDLDKFVNEKRIIAPVLNNSFKYDRKSYSISCKNGWHRISFVNNNAKIIDEDVGPYEIFDDPQYPKSKMIKGYALNNKFIFKSAREGELKFGTPLMNDLIFSDFEDPQPVISIYHNKMFFFVSIDYSDVLLYECIEKLNSIDLSYNQQEIKKIFESNETEQKLKDMSIQYPQGTTPELKIFGVNFLMKKMFSEYQIILANEMLAIEQEEARKREWLNTFPGRITSLFAMAGGVVLDIDLQKNRAIVTWKIDGNNRDRFNSVIDLRTMKIEEAGYCMSGDDKRHNITSLVLTAREYDEKDLIYITRRV
jgi:hypothetical protein